jgi:hypothetical protein
MPDIEHDEGNEDSDSHDRVSLRLVAEWRCHDDPYTINKNEQSYQATQYFYNRFQGFLSRFLLQGDACTGY